MHSNMSAYVGYLASIAPTCSLVCFRVRVLGGCEAQQTVISHLAMQIYTVASKCSMGLRQERCTSLRLPKGRALYASPNRNVNS